MSDAPGDETGDGGQAGGNRPQGGQGQGGAPPGGYQTGPSISDIFSRPETMKEIKIGLLGYTIISVGLGVGAFGLTTIGSGGSGMGMSAGTLLVPLITLMSPFILAAAIAGILGFRHASELDDEPQNLVLGTSAFTGFVGSIIMFLVGFVFSMMAAGGSGGSGGGGGSGGALGDLLLPVLIVGIGAAIAGAGCAWASQNILAKPKPSQPPAGAQQRQ